MKKYKKIIIDLCIFIVVLLIAFISFKVLTPPKSDYTEKELIYYFENNNYEFSYFYSKDNVYTADIEPAYISITLTNNNYNIYYNEDTTGKYYLLFNDKSINDEFYIIASNDEEDEESTEIKHQKESYKQWLKNNEITNNQILKLPLYCINNKYNTDIK